MLKPRQLSPSFHAELYTGLSLPTTVLRKIGAVVDFSFMNELLADSYCRYYGTPAEEPELMLGLLSLQFLYHLSDQQVMQDAQVNLAYKWFVGLSPEDSLPDPSALSRFRTQRIGKSGTAGPVVRFGRVSAQKGIPLLGRNGGKISLRYAADEFRSRFTVIR